MIKNSNYQVVGIRFIEYYKQRTKLLGVTMYIKLYGYAPYIIIIITRVCYSYIINVYTLHIAGGAIKDHEW